MRVARAFRYSIIAAMTALALSGCMRRSAPVAVVQPQNDLDSLAGTWSEEQETEFLNAVADFEQVDEKLWR